MAISQIPFSRAPLFALPAQDAKRATPPESPLVQFAETILDSARRYRDLHLGMADRWKSYRAWYLSAGDAYGKRSTTYVNLIFEKVESVPAEMGESDPSFLYSPRSEKDVRLNDFLNHHVPFTWDAEDGRGKYHEGLKGGCLYGTTYWKIPHDPGFPSSGPRIRIQPLAPWYLYPAPYATSMEDAPFVIEVRPRTVGEIFNDYGVRVTPEMVRRDTDIADHLKTYPPTVQTETATNTDAGQAGGELVTGVYGDYLSTFGDTGIVFQKELWIKDASKVMEWHFEELPDSPIPKFRRSQNLKYPTGRVISWANGRLLYDRPNPYRDGEFPYATFRDIPMPDFWFGLGEVEPLINLQMLHDDTHEVIKQIHLFTALGRLIVDTSTGLEEGQLGNSPGEIWWTNPGTSDRIKWFPGLPPPAELYNYLNVVERAIDTVSGRFDVTRGINPTGVTSGRALYSLQSAANTRVRFRLRETERTLKRVAKLLGSRVQQFASSELSARVGAPSLNPDEKVFRRFFLTPEDREAGFHVEVAAVANVDKLKAAEFQKLLLLYQMGLLDERRLIEGADLSQEVAILAELPAMQMKKMLKEQITAAAQKPERARAGSEADQQSRRQRANTRAISPQGAGT